MSPTPDKILHLRQLMEERFGKPIQLGDRPHYQTGMAVLDEIGLPQGALTEIVTPPGAGPGGALFFYGLLHRVLSQGERLALIDARDAFEPKALAAEDFTRLLWTRCQNANEAIKAADLIVRDGNIPLVIIHLSLNPPAQLRRIPATAWHRLQILAEKSAVSCVAITPHALIGSAHLRLVVDGSLPPSMLNLNRDQLSKTISLKVERRRTGFERGCSDEKVRRSVCA